MHSRDPAERRHGNHHHAARPAPDAPPPHPAEAVLPDPLRRAEQNLALALRLRLRHGPLDRTAATIIALALDAAAQAVQARR